MGVVFGNFACLDPIILRDWCFSQDPPLPISQWWGIANAMRVPHGMTAGQGWLLMRRGEADSLDIDTQYDLVFSGISKLITLKNLCFVKYVVITPGVRGDDNAHTLVEIRDRRWRYLHYTIDSAYNVRFGAGANEYYTETEDSGSPWTWDRMVENIWNNINGLPTWPGLPFTPHGTPEGWFFYGENAWDALTCVLNRLTCTLKLDPFTDAITIVQIGVANADTTLALNRHDTERMWDDEPQEATKGRCAENVRVVFRKFPQPKTDNLSPYYTIDQATGVDGEPGTTYTLYDDLYALYDNTGTLSNLSTLTARATERNTDYVRAIQLGMIRLHRVYIDALNDVGFRPDGTIRAESYEDRGLGTKTEIVRHPFVLPQCRLPLGGVPPMIFVQPIFHEEFFEDITINPMAFICPSISPGSTTTCCPSGSGFGPGPSDTIRATLSVPSCTLLDGETVDLTWVGSDCWTGNKTIPNGVCLDCIVSLTLCCDHTTGTYTINGLFVVTGTVCWPFVVTADMNAEDISNNCCNSGDVVTITFTIL